NSHWGQMVLLGIVICVIGIIVCGKAGMMKEKDLAKNSTAAANNKDYRFGLEAGKPMADTANAVWVAAHPAAGNFLFRNNVTYVVVLWGGLTTNFIWCMLLNFRNRTFGDYTNSKTPLLKNYLFSALAGVTWFLQFFFYGMGESRMGNGASSWILHMAFIILVANMWGLVLKEWKGVSKKALATVIAGIVVIMVSVLLVGYGNSIK